MVTSFKEVSKDSGSFMGFLCCHEFIVLSPRCMSFRPRGSVRLRRPEHASGEGGENGSSSDRWWSELTN